MKKKYLLTIDNHIYKREVKNTNIELYAGSIGEMIPLENGDEFIAPICFRQNSKHCSRCAYDKNLFFAIKKETDSIIIALLWRIFYRKKKFPWKSKK